MGRARELTDICSFPAPGEVVASNLRQPSKNSLTYRLCVSSIRNPVMLIAPYSIISLSHRSSMICSRWNKRVGKGEKRGQGTRDGREKKLHPQTLNGLLWHNNSYNIRAQKQNNKLVCNNIFVTFNLIVSFCVFSACVGLLACLLAMMREQARGFLRYVMLCCHVIIKSSPRIAEKLYL